MKKFKHLKNFKELFEDGNATVNATTTGMGAVVSPQPGEVPGTFGTDGSGDIPFYLTDDPKKKRKKGNPSEVSDLRDLKPETGITKIEESLDDYIIEIKDMLKSYNLRPVVLDDIINQYQDTIEEFYDEGKYAKFFVEDIVKDLELDSGGYMTTYSKQGYYSNRHIHKYL